MISIFDKHTYLVKKLQNGGGFWDSLVSKVKEVTNDVSKSVNEAIDYTMDATDKIMAPDYTDKGDFEKAFVYARDNGDKYFMYNGERKTTLVKPTYKTIVRTPKRRVPNNRVMPKKENTNIGNKEIIKKKRIVTPNKVITKVIKQKVDTVPPVVKPTKPSTDLDNFKSSDNKRYAIKHHNYGGHAQSYTVYNQDGSVYRNNVGDFAVKEYKIFDSNGKLLNP